MYVKKILHQPNVVGSVLMALLFGAGVVFAFGFDGFNVSATTEGETEALLRMSMSGCCGEEDYCYCGSAVCKCESSDGCYGAILCEDECTGNCKDCDGSGDGGRYSVCKETEDETCCPDGHENCYTPR